MKYWKSCLAAVACCLASHALALDSEGAYKITSRQACAGEQIDSIVLMTDEAGIAKAYLATQQYGLVYQVHLLTISDSGALAGTTISGDAATFTAEISQDGQHMTGTVDTIACPAAWTFTAERLQLPERPAMGPLDQVPQLLDFVGSFDAERDRQPGTIRFVRLADDRLAAGFASGLSRQVLGFGIMQLDVEARAVDLFARGDNGQTRLKWHLGYGQINGVMALQGYGLSTTGTFYPVGAIRL